ncbi:MAG: cupin domain-containing protein [Acidimicrobiia bacterium]|nr:cupin domain-containing protein [Acidimicrobiia bacterium]
MENVFADSWDQESDRPGFLWKRMRLARRLGGELLGGSVYELPAGEKSFPYHFHHANEEMLIVLSGSVMLRTPTGSHTMEPGDVELFNTGAKGAHQVINETEAPARFLMMSTMVNPEIAEYPDSGNVGVFAEPPPGHDEETRLFKFLDGAAERPYFHGEPLPEES